MRNLTLIAALIFSNQLFSQYVPNATICDTPIVANFTPAPCNIAGNGIESDIYLIQIGTYVKPINPFPNTMTIEYQGVRRYYLMYFFYSYDSAKDYFNNHLDRNLYCDAFIVVFPVAGFKIYR